MPEIKFDRQKHRDSDANAKVIEWANVTENDTCEPYKLQGQGGGLCSLQAEGTFGTVVIALGGSNNGAQYHDRNDIENNPIAIGDGGGLVEVSTGALYVRPYPKSGAGGTVTITLVERRQ